VMESESFEDEEVAEILNKNLFPSKWTEKNARI